MTEKDPYETQELIEEVSNCLIDAAPLAAIGTIMVAYGLDVDDVEQSHA